MEDEEDYARFPVHIDFIKNYGHPDSYMDLDSIKQFIEWRSEFENAIFKDANGDHSFNDNDDIHITTVSEIGKMSKRYFNVVNPDDVVDEYGADCFRMYEMFLGPIEQSKPWDTNGIDGVSKFLRKFWLLFHDENENFVVSEDKASPDAVKVLHKTIKKVSSDIEKLSFNTSVSAFMVAVNELRKMNANQREVLEPLVQLIAPFAPFISEELWEKLGHESSVHLETYPTFDPTKLVESDITYPVCINGKKKFLKTYPADMDKAAIEKDVVSLEELEKYLEGKPIKKTIVVPGRIINFIV